MVIGCDFIVDEIDEEIEQKEGEYVDRKEDIKEYK